MIFYILTGSASYYSLTEASGRPSQIVLFDYVALFQASPATEVQKWLCLISLGFWVRGLVSVFLTNPDSNALRAHTSRLAIFSFIFFYQRPNLGMKFSFCISIPQNLTSCAMRLKIGLVIFVFISMSDCLLHLSKIFAALRDRVRMTSPTPPRNPTGWGWSLVA